MTTRRRNNPHLTPAQERIAHLLALDYNKREIQTATGWGRAIVEKQIKKLREALGCGYRCNDTAEKAREYLARRKERDEVFESVVVELLGSCDAAGGPGVCGRVQSGQRAATAGYGASGANGTRGASLR